MQRNTATSKKGQPKTISIYFEERLHRKIQAKAEANDMSLSQYLRRLVRKDLQEAA